MTILAQMKRIRCVSEFEDRDVDEAVLTTIVEAASWTPSAADLQPWEIVAIREGERKRALVGILLDSHMRPGSGGELRRHWLADSPVILVVCMDHTRAKVRLGEIGEALFGIQDVGAAIQNMRLVALELGVKSCLLREFDHQRMSEWLELPSHVCPLTLIAMGYSQVEPPQKPGLPLSDYFHHEMW
jgi:nitroreductase